MTRKNQQRVLITGGAGFLARQVTELLAIRQIEVVGVDVHTAALTTPLVEVDLRDGTALREAVDDIRPTAVLHLASMLSQDCERDPRGAFEANVLGTLNLIEALPRSSSVPIVFASSIAAMSARIGTDRSPTAPRSVYAATKIMAETLVADATRRAEVQGTTVFLPTVLVKEVPSSGAASAFASEALVSALSGSSVRIPVPKTLRMVFASTMSVSRNLTDLVDMSLRETVLPPRFTLPGVSVGMTELANMCERLGQASPTDWTVDSDVLSIVGAWPSEWLSTTAAWLNLEADVSLDDIVSKWRTGHPAEGPLRFDEQRSSVSRP